MNCFAFDDLQVGMEEKFTVRVTDGMMQMFRQLSGDINPLHTNDDYAKSAGFPRKVVYGMLYASFLSTLAGVYLPGKYCLLHEVKTSFVRPVFVGDTLEISGKISHKNDTFRQVEIKGGIRNQNGEKVARAVILAGVLK